MKKIFAIILMISFGGTVVASSGKMMGSGLTKVDKKNNGIIFFHGTWKEALKKAAKEKKIIFLDAYAEWCGPCKLMASKTFTDDEVGTFFNKHFINIKMDMEKNVEGTRLSKKFKLVSYPSLYFIDENEEIVHKTVGYMRPKELILVGQEALK